MKKSIVTLLCTFSTVLLTGCSMLFGSESHSESSHLGGSSQQEKSFSISVNEPVIAGERAEIMITKSYDFNMLHKDYTFSVIGDNSVGGTFEFQTDTDYTHKYFKAASGGTVQIQAKNTTSGTLLSNILQITVQEIDSSLILDIQQPATATTEIPQPANFIMQSWDYTLTAEKETKTFSFLAQTANLRPLTKGKFLFVSTFAVNWVFRDSANNLVDKEDYGATSMPLTLTVGQTYTISIIEYTTKGNVTVNAYAPNGSSDISGFTTVNDCLWWKGQQALYVYTPQFSGLYRFVTPYNVNWLFKDSFGNTVSKEDYGADNFLISLNADETYSISLIQYSSTTGVIELMIHNPNPEADITGKQKIHDVIRYTGQQNRYTFIPVIAATYNMTTTLTVNWTIKDSFGNTVLSETYGATAKSKALKTGEKYTITLCQYGKNKGEYTFEIKH